MYRVELSKSLIRRRTIALAIVFGGIPLLIVIGVLASAPTNPGEGPPFLFNILQSGLFAPLTALAIIQPFFLPVAASLFAGETIAGEASAGTLRYLLAQPVGRVRLLISKYLSSMTLVLLIVLWVVVVGSIAGAWAFGLGQFAVFGSPISSGAVFLRILVAAGYITLGVSGLVAIGVFVSTLTESAPGATVATVVFAIISQILGALSSLHAIHPYLLTQQWEAFGDLFRDPVSWHNMFHGVIVDAFYVAIFLGVALYRFRRKDIAA
ncbi:MAG: ABC transporter permease [Actinomycetota bacterium]